MKTLTTLAACLTLSGCAVWNAPVASGYRCQTANIGTKYARSYCTDNGRLTYIQSKPYKSTYRKR